MSTPPSNPAGPAPEPENTPPSPAGAPAAGTPPPPSTGTAPAAKPPVQEPAQNTGAIIGAVVVLVIVVGLAVAAGYYLVSNPAQASVWRDVFIIFMALEALFIGAALIVLMIQLATLTNVLKNEIKPILEATQETVNTVRGTTLFVSENLTEPIMKLNSYVAGLSKIVETLSSLGGFFRRP